MMYLHDTMHLFHHHPMLDYNLIYIHHNSIILKERISTRISFLSTHLMPFVSDENTVRDFAGI